MCNFVMSVTTQHSSPLFIDTAKLLKPDKIMPKSIYKVNFKYKKKNIFDFKVETIVPGDLVLTSKMYVYTHYFLILLRVFSHCPLVGMLYLFKIVHGAVSIDVKSIRDTVCIDERQSSFPSFQYYRAFLAIVVINLFLSNFGLL